MSTPPQTELEVGALEAEAIRAAVRRADPRTLDPGRDLARVEDAQALTELLSDPRVSDPIHDLPRPICAEAIAPWIEAFLAAKARGEGLLMVTRELDGSLSGYSKVTVWPDRSAAELAGAIRADRQNTGQGGAGAWRSVHWIFETLNVRLVCLTADMDNIRSARLIEAMGFVRLGDRITVGDDGTERPSLYWEMTREAWRGPQA